MSINPNSPEFQGLSPHEKLERIKAAFFTPEGREERIARGLKALEGPRPDFHLSPEMWKHIAESPDLPT